MLDKESLSNLQKEGKIIIGEKGIQYIYASRSHLNKMIENGIGV